MDLFKSSNIPKLTNCEETNLELYIWDQLRIREPFDVFCKSSDYLEWRNVVEITAKGNLRAYYKRKRNLDDIKSLQEEIEDTYCAIDYDFNSWCNYGIHIPKKNKITMYINTLTDEFASIKELTTYIADSEDKEYCLQDNFRGMGSQSISFARLLNKKYNETM